MTASSSSVTEKYTTRDPPTHHPPKEGSRHHNSPKGPRHQKPKQRKK